MRESDTKKKGMREETSSGNPLVEDGRNGEKVGRLRSVSDGRRGSC